MTHPAAAPQAGEVLEITGGVDTHNDSHTAAALDPAERLLGHRQFPASPAGYTALLVWLRTFGEVVLVGIEGTGAYGAGLGCSCASPGSPWSRSTARTGPPDAIWASPIRSTPRPLPAPRSPGAPPVSPSTATAPSRPCGCCASPAAAPSLSAPMPNAGSRRSSSSPPPPLRAMLRELGDRDLIAHCATRRPDRGAAADPGTALTIALRALAPTPPAAHHRDRGPRHPDRPAGRADQPDPVRAARGRCRRRRAAPAHRRRQPATATFRGRVRHALRGRPAARVLRAHPAPPAQPGRGPPRQRCALPDRALPAAPGPPHPGLRRQAHRAGPEQEKRSSAASSATSHARSTPPYSHPKILNSPLDIHRSIPVDNSRAIEQMFGRIRACRDLGAGPTSSSPTRWRRAGRWRRCTSGSG